MATQPQRSRQSRALEMLQSQLKSGLKTEKKRTDGHTIPLTDKDKNRIQKEIDTLKSKV
jgi:flagellin-like hook-associated protein FlgL